MKYARVSVCLVLTLALAGPSPTQRQTRNTKQPAKTAAVKKSADGTWQCSGAPFPPPPTSISSALAQIPYDFCGEIEQYNFDNYSWLTFIALNWPANGATCTANTSGTFGTGPTVWETYMQSTNLFVAPGSQPQSWCAQNPTATAQWKALPQAVRDIAQRTGVTRVIRQNAKASQQALPDFPGVDEAVGGTLTDQNGRFVRYEITTNWDEYNYITTNSLWSLDGQSSFTPPLSFKASDPSNNVMGAMEIKAAWKVLGANDDSSRFYTTQAIVFNDAAGDPSPCPVPVTLGLVGLHIAHKTQAQTNWIWSTFEQVDNTTKSFNNPNCPASQCPPNKQTAVTSYEMNSNCTPANPPVQVTRVTDIAKNDETAVQLNAIYRKLLAGTVWENYQLIGTQWTGELGTAPKPAILANTTLETFIQPTSSCIGCHGSATLPQRTTVNSDFSYVFLEAQ